MAGVRPAGSTESWQSWMDSLAKQTEAGEPEAKTDEASAAATDAAKPVTPIEMSPEAFYAVEEEAMRVKIGDEEDYEEASDEPEAATADPAFAGGFDPNESQARTPGESAAPLATAPAAETFEIPAAASGSRAPSLPDFESAPGFNWDTPAARGEPVAPIKSATPVARVETPAPVARIEPAAPWTPDAPVERAAVSARADEVMPAAVPPAPAARREAPTARVSAAPAQPMAAAKAMPIRLRERIEAAERAESSQGSPATGWIIGAAVLVIVTVGIVLAMRTRKSVAPTTHTSATTSAASGEPATETSSGEAVSSPTTSGSETPAASTPRPSALAAPPAAVAPRTSAAATLAKPSAPPATHAANPPAVKPAPSTPAPVVASVTVPKPVTHKPVSKTRFGVSVASFLAEERANTEGARLSAATGLASRVVATKDGDYRVVLGSFPDRAAAEQAAGNLIGGGKVDEARVISLGSSDK